MLTAPVASVGLSLRCREPQNSCSSTPSLDADRVGEHPANAYPGNHMSSFLTRRREGGGRVSGVRLEGRVSVTLPLTPVHVN